MTRPLTTRVATTLITICSFLGILSSVAAANDSSIASMHIYMVEAGNEASITEQQKALHRFYEQQPGFVGSFALQDTNHASVRQDYSFWKTLKDFNAAREKAKSLDSQKALTAAISNTVVDQTGTTHGASHHRRAVLGEAVVEMAVFGLKRPFEEGFLPVRPTVKEWLDHHRGTNGYISIPSTTDNRRMADVVLWTNLNDALYAANLLQHLDFGQRLNSEIADMSYYGHFNIHGQYFGKGVW